MTKSSLPSTLSNNDLLAATRALVVRSNEVSVELISHLAEVDERKLYLEQAQPSMFAWCVAELGCSEDVTCNWIAVARASRRYPAVLDALREGKVHLTGLRIIAPHLTDEGHLALLDAATGRSKREIEELIASIAPRPAVPASIRKLPGVREKGGAGGSVGGGLDPLTSKGGGGDSGAGSADCVGGGAGAVSASTPTEGDQGQGRGRPAGEHLFGAKPGSPAAPPQAADRPRTPGRVEPLSGEAYKVTFTASRRLRDKIRQAQDLLGHQVAGGDLAEIVERGLDLLMEDVKKKRFAVGRKPRAGKAKRQQQESTARQGREPPAAVATAAATETSVPGGTTSRKAETTPMATETNPTPAEQPPSLGAKRRSRYIPAEVRRAVFERDGGQCTYVDARGRRCPETRSLELDHADGFARGAPNTVDALRVRCHGHNQWEAERMYGRAFMEAKRAAKASAPAREDSISVGRGSKHPREIAA